ncbi:MAG: exopolyphosphatase [Desulfuromonadales bacterium]|nr:exopolyphosphatase [Desulfuromonadales bacterium]
MAAIDIGSNTVRLLLGSVVRGQVVPSQYVRRITRLKGGQTDTGLSAEAIERTLFALKEFSEIISRQPIDAIRVVGTEAVRSAANRRDFVARVLNETGLRLEIVSGDEEASLSASGVCSQFAAPVAGCLLVFDIGGGSTEFILLQQGEILFQKSCQLGVVALSESLSDFDHRHNFISAAITEIFSTVEPILKQLSITPEMITLIGTAGTATTLAALDMQMSDYDWRLVNGYTLDLNTIQSIYNRLDCLTVAEREELPGMEPGRGDLIPAGIEIIVEIIRQFRAAQLTVSDFGLLEGVLLSMSTISRPND